MKTAESHQHLSDASIKDTALRPSVSPLGHKASPLGRSFAEEGSEARARQAGSR